MGRLAAWQGTWDQWMVQVRDIDGAMKEEDLHQDKDTDMVLSLLIMDFSSFLVSRFGG